MGLNCIVITFSMILLCVGNVVSWLNLYVSRAEGKRILGLNAELRYVNNGTINDYALGFSVMVPDDIWELYFTWQSLHSMPIPYSMDIRVSNLEAMMYPLLNVTRKGNIPAHLEVFRMILRCSGKVNSLVEIFMRMSFTLQPPFPETIHLLMRRKKICYKRNNTSSDTLMIADAMIATANSFYMAAGFASVVIVTVAMVTIYCYLRKVKERTDTIHFRDTTPNISSSSQKHTFLRPTTPSSNSYANSYTTFKSFTPINSMPIYNNVNVVKPVRDPRNASEQVAKIRMERKNIIFREKIQEGTYGRIYSAIIRYDDIVIPKGLPVFVKTVTDQANSIQTSLLIKEGMKMLGLRHEFILPLIGLCTEDYLHPILVYPFMANGNLKLFLQKCSMAHNYALMTIDLVSMAIQIAKAIEYLHARGIIHKDIATRNCLVNEYLKVKLADNALARDLFPNDYHCLCDSENRPIKWLAIESIARNEFSYATDVWSYGVTMWELITLGHQPYASVDAFEMYSTLMDGYRLNQPKHCPDDLYKFIRFCWSEIPEIRPSVTELIRCLQDLYTKLGSFI